MSRFWTPLYVLLIGAALVLPHLVFAAITPPDGGIATVSNCTSTTYAGWGAFITVLGKLVQFAMYLGVIIAVLTLAYSGFLLVLNPAMPDNRSRAKKVMIGA